MAVFETIMTRRFPNKFSKFFFPFLYDFYIQFKNFYVSLNFNLSALLKSSNTGTVRNSISRNA